jgi:hypothetical protein
MAISLISEFISLLGGSAILVGCAGWLATKIIENRLASDIESYKTRLKMESDSEIENLKSRLQIAAKEREIAISWLHQKRANAIETLYAAMVELQEAVRIVLDIFSPRNAADIRKYSQAAVDKIRQTYGAYLKAKIFLSPKTCEKIEAVLGGIEDPIIMYNLYLKNYEDHELHSLRDVKEHAWEELQKVVPDALKELEIDFRNVLGVANIMES